MNGKYDFVSAMALGVTGADMAAVFVVNGAAGNGISMSIQDGKQHLAQELPKLLRTLADLIEKECAKAGDSSTLTVSE